jgi:hypothetical protein
MHLHLVSSSNDDDLIFHKVECERGSVEVIDNDERTICLSVNTGTTLAYIVLTSDEVGAIAEELTQAHTRLAAAR